MLQASKGIIQGRLRPFAVPHAVVLLAERRWPCWFRLGIIVAGGSSKKSGGSREKEERFMLRPGKCKGWECVTCRALPGSLHEVLLGEEFFLLHRRKREAMYFHRAYIVHSFFLLSFTHKINIILIRCIFLFWPGNSVLVTVLLMAACLHGSSASAKNNFAASCHFQIDFTGNCH